MHKSQPFLSDWPHTAPILAPMKTEPRPINAHRLDRLIVCARAAIVWAAAVFLDGLLPNRRRIRQRYGLLSIDKLTRIVRNLMIARTAQMVTRAPGRAVPRNFAPPGFRRRMRPRNLLNAIAGARLRRFLKAGDDAQRFARLIRVLGNIDAYVRRFLLRRGRRGVSRLNGLRVVRPPHHAARSLAAPVLAFADSS